jgi:nitroreductase
MLQFKQFIKSIILMLRLPFLRIFSSTFFLSAFFYIIFSRAFWREFNSVLMGRYLYLKRLHEKSENIFLMRRNVHRLEKGLLMRPRRAVFGLKYIEELINVYERLVSQDIENDLSIKNQLIWAHDVLEKYLSIVGEHPIISKCRDQFEKIDIAYESDEKKVPFNRITKGSPVQYVEFFKLTKNRCSVRWFLPKPVPRKMIDQAILAAVQSPSSCNRLPYEFRVIDDKKMVKDVSTIPMGTEGFADNIPVIIAVVGHLDAFFHERDRHLIYIDASLASMAMVLSFETMGLSTCCLNWPDIPKKEKKISKALNLERKDRVIMFIAVGWADPEGKVAYSEKKPLNIIRKYN